ncbi:unnamed protein product [Phytophthora fragariaefolia]|uniref:Unnamed protein product n=1 Tax=Phytophthora fragariaefolia TaxID=1490495 RepID=A0A9W7D108_9STRA|nr:unnamed protein product [Phytophthora fragariaefolia]
MPVTGLHGPCYTVPVVVCGTQFLRATPAGVVHTREHPFSLKRALANSGPITPSLTQTGSTCLNREIQRKHGHGPIRQFTLSRHKPRTAGPPGVPPETQMILRAAPDALGAAGPAEHDADAPTPSETEEKPPAPASKKHSGDPEEMRGTSASKKHANDVNEKKKTPAPEKPTTGA